MLKRKVQPSTSGVFDQVKELKKSRAVFIERDVPYKAWVTDFDENNIIYSSGKYSGDVLIGEYKHDLKLEKNAVNDNYELDNTGDTSLLKLKQQAGGGKRRAPGKRVIHGRARVVYVGPRGGEYIKKDGKFVRI